MHVNNVYLYNNYYYKVIIMYLYNYNIIPRFFDQIQPKFFDCMINELGLRLSYMIINQFNCVYIALVKLKKSKKYMYQNNKKQIL